MNRWQHRSWIVLLTAALVLAGVAGAYASAAPRVAPTVDPSVMSTSTLATPVMARDFKPSVQLSAQTLAQMRDKLNAKRLELAARVAQPNTAAAQAAPNTAASSVAPSTQFHGTPSSLVIGRNIKDTLADENTCGTASTLAEPAAANEGPHVYYTGNLRHQEFATSIGAGNWACAGAYPAGPAAAPIPFGDTDVIYDHSRGVTFHSVLYVNAAITDGVIGIFVRRNINVANNCVYFLDLDPAATVLPDYPKLALSNNFVYTNANRVNLVANAWLGATIRRHNADQMADCVGASGNNINFTNAGGQRILVPGHGARNVMFFAWVDTATQWRVFSWADNSGVVFSTFITVAAMTFGDASCRGGLNNADWSGPLNTSIVGFSVRTAIGNDFVHVWTAVPADAGHPHAYIQGAMLRVGAAQNALTLVQQPQIWFTDRCAGLPNVGANDRGDQGLAIALGGASAGGGPAVTTAVGMKDEFNPGPGGFSFILIATATHNPTRYGDYFTVRRQAPCGEFFTTTGYGFNGGTALANINARYVEFGRGRDNQCYLAWRNAVPAT